MTAPHLRRPARRLVGTTVLVLACAAVAGTALAALSPHLRAGALYTGRSTVCGHPPSGETCTFAFRATSTGLAMQFVGKTVVDVYGCPGGGGEALLGGKATGANPVPVIKVLTRGRLYGAVRYSTTVPTTHATYHYEETAMGSITHGGASASVTFHNIYLQQSGNIVCATPSVRLTAH